MPPVRRATPSAVPQPGVPPAFRAESSRTHKRPVTGDPTIRRPQATRWPRFTAHSRTLLPAASGPPGTPIAPHTLRRAHCRRYGRWVTSDANTGGFVPLSRSDFVINKQRVFGVLAAWPPGSTLISVTVLLLGSWAPDLARCEPWRARMACGGPAAVQACPHHHGRAALARQWVGLSPLPMWVLPDGLPACCRPIIACMGLFDDVSARAYASASPGQPGQCRARSPAADRIGSSPGGGRGGEGTFAPDPG